MPAFDDGMAQTEIPTGQVVETDVLVVGSGPSGAAASLMLSELGIVAALNLEQASLRVIQPPDFHQRFLNLAPNLLAPNAKRTTTGR